MKFSDDDFIGTMGQESDTATAEDIAIFEHLKNVPGNRVILEKMFAAEINAAALSGEDIDDAELMGGKFLDFIKKVGGKIRQRIKARRGGGSINIETPFGTLNAGATAATGAGAGAGSGGAGGIMDTIKKNPLFLIVPAGLLGAFLLMRKK